MKEEIMEIALKRGFLIPSNEIYGPVSGFYEYGSIGTPMKRKIERAWRELFLYRDGNYEIETAHVLPEIVLKASGHLANFGDPLVECKSCKKKFRADTLVADQLQKEVVKGGEHAKRLKEHLSRLAGMKPEEMSAKIKEFKIKCPDCDGQLAEVGWFNLMFKTNIGPIEGNAGYLRPETAQGIFTAFPRVFRAHGGKLPLGIGQVGRSFRNEISPRQGLIRLREFTQMELEYFFNPEKQGHPKFSEVASEKIRLLTRETQLAGKEEEQEISIGDAVKKGILPNEILAYFLARESEFYKSMGVPYEKFRFRHMLKEETPHYSGGNFDLEVSTSFGWVETIGTAYRTDYDLKSHQGMSKQDLTVFIEEEKKRILPHVVEPSLGVDRLFWCILEHCIRDGGWGDQEEPQTEGGKPPAVRDWAWFDFPPAVAPFDCAVLPLMKKDGLKGKAEEIVGKLREEGLSCYYDESGSIGKRYARQDEIGTPYCMTIDYDTLKDGTVTIRFRNDGKQTRLKVGDLAKSIREYVKAGKVAL